MYNQGRRGASNSEVPLPVKLVIKFSKGMRMTPAGDMPGLPFLNLEISGCTSCVQMDQPGPFGYPYP